MRIHYTRNTGTFTRFGIFSNLADRADRRACEGWYCNLHLGFCIVEIYGSRS